MDFESLTDEQKAKLRECKTPEDLLALAKEENYELSEEELDSISAGIGGINWDFSDCENFYI